MDSAGLRNGTKPDNVTSSSTRRLLHVDQCEAKLYDETDLPEQNTPEYKRCVALQRDLNQAARQGNVERINDVLEKGANVNGGYYQEGSPLEQAITKGRTEAVRLLIQNGADVNAVYLFGGTPLKRAAYYDFSDIAKVLIENGADLCSNEPNDFNQRLTALDIAKEAGHDEMVRILIDAGAMKCR